MHFISNDFLCPISNKALPDLFYPFTCCLLKLRFIELSYLDFMSLAYLWILIDVGNSKRLADRKVLGHIFINPRFLKFFWMFQHCCLFSRTTEYFVTFLLLFLFLLLPLSFLYFRFFWRNCLVVLWHTHGFILRDHSRQYSRVIPGFVFRCDSRKCWTWPYALVKNQNWLLHTRQTP